MSMHYTVLDKCDKSVGLVLAANDESLLFVFFFVFCFVDTDSC